MNISEARRQLWDWERFHCASTDGNVAVQLVDNLLKSDGSNCSIYIRDFCLPDQEGKPICTYREPAEAREWTLVAAYRFIRHDLMWPHAIDFRNVALERVTKNALSYANEASQCLAQNPSYKLSEEEMMAIEMVSREYRKRSNYGGEISPVGRRISERSERYG